MRIVILMYLLQVLLFSTNVAAVATIPGSTAATAFAATVLTSATALTNLAKNREPPTFSPETCFVSH